MPRLSDRLQPALLDRLTDDAPHLRHDADDGRVMSRARLRQAVLRDLSWLLNAVRPLSSEQTQHFSEAAGSVLAFGLPPIAGQPASEIDIAGMEAMLRQAIVRFEPRIVPTSLSVRAVEASVVLETHNVIEFEIHGLLWSQPVPLEMLLRTQFDLEAGKVEVREAVQRSTAAGM